jgi:hypothetical protein
MSSIKRPARIRNHYETLAMAPVSEGERYGGLRGYGSAMNEPIDDAIRGLDYFSNGGIADFRNNSTGLRKGR